MVGRKQLRGNGAEMISRRGRAALLADWWLVLGLAIALTALAVHHHWAARLDSAAYDVAARHRAGQSHAAGQTVIVAIDDSSLAALGAWPWPRAVQARLIGQIAAARPAALGLDILFAEPRPGDADLARALADARRQGLRTVLPVAFAVPGPNGAGFAVTPPLPALVTPAAVPLGHVNLAPDGDGVIRRVWRSYAGGGAAWAALPAVMLGQGPDAAAAAAQSGGAQLEGSDPRLIDWRGGPGAIPTVPAAAMVAGTVPPALLAGRQVLVGVTAAGLGDYHAVPVGDGALMAGVEIQANVLETLAQSGSLRAAGQGPALVLALVPLIALFVAMRRLPAGWTALAALALALAVIAASAGLFAAGLWLSPVTAVVALALSWPVWAWARLVVTGRYISRALERAAADAGELAPVAAGHASPLDRQLALLESATARERRLRAEHDEVIRLLSHDMRSPQSAILALTERADDGPLPPETVAQVRDHARRTLALSDGFVHLSRAQMLEWEPQLLDLAELARDAADALWALARDAGMTITVEGAVGAGSETGAEVLVMGEPSLLNRMIANLAGNAIKYGDPGTPVRIVVAAEGLHATLCVINRGPAIAPDRIATLFDRFSRAATGGNGAGLGLAFVHTVATRHHGTAECRSERHAGGGETCFTVTLPLAPADPVSRQPT
jgi:CHASE2 domain-containing sensor protein